MATDVDAVDELSAELAAKRLSPLPAGGHDWLRTHPAVAARLAATVAALEPWEYIQYQYHLVAREWADSEELVREFIREKLDDGSYTFTWTGRWRVERYRDWVPGWDVNEDEALSCRDAARIFPGISETEARRVLRHRVAEGDSNPQRVHGAWLATLRWWRTVLPQSATYR